MKGDRLLILDIDECLIHSIHKTKSGEMSYDFFKNSFNILDGVYRTMARPNLSEFMEYAFSNFNVAVWTAAGEGYANDILEKIGIDKSKLMFFYTESNCTAEIDYDYKKGIAYTNYYKNISKLNKFGYDMNQVLMIDDKPEYIDYYDNVIKIKPFYGDTDDVELLKMIKYLDKVKDELNYRSIDKTYLII